MTHAELIKRAERWLMNTKKCSFVLTELVTSAGEIPDAIGFNSTTSILIECKTSRTDFFIDRKKTFRRMPEYGMGDQRFYMIPPGLVQIDDLPKRWGLLWAYPNYIRIMKGSGFASFHSKYQWYNERRLLVSALRRVNEAKQLSCIYRKEKL